MSLKNEQLQFIFKKDANWKHGTECGVSEGRWVREGGGGEVIN